MADETRLEHSAPAPDARGRIFAVLNPVAGTTEPEAVRAAIEAYIESQGWQVDIHESSGDENVQGLVRDALAEGVEAVLACGGDGTVSQVAAALVGKEVPLGVLPAGSGNVLAQELEIPLDLEEAAAFVAAALADGEPAVRVLDVLRMGEHTALLAARIGLLADTISDTSREAKRVLGFVAYVLTWLPKLAGWQPHHFVIEVDGRRRQVKASQVTIANSGLISKPGLRWGSEIRVDDGLLDVCLTPARSLWDFVKVGAAMILGRQRSEPQIHCQQGRGVTVSTANASPALDVDCDGEIVGRTPVSVEVVPASLRVMAPRN